MRNGDGNVTEAAAHSRRRCAMEKELAIARLTQADIIADGAASEPNRDTTNASLPCARWSATPRSAP
jgi:hypothetical protein